MVKKYLHNLAIFALGGLVTVGVVLIEKYSSPGYQNQMLLILAATFIAVLIYFRVSVDRDKSPNSDDSQLDILQRSEKEYREIFENSTQGIVITTPRGRFIRANQSFARILGYDSTDELVSAIVDIGIDIWVNPAERREMLKRLYREDTLYLETEFIHKKGHKIWVSMAVWGKRDEQGQLTNIVAILDDITRRKTADIKLESSERRFLQLIENTQEGYWSIDVDGATTDVNPAMCKIMQRTRDEIIGKTIFDFVDEENAKIFRAQLKRRKEGYKGAYEISFTRPDGSNIFCLNNATPIYDEQDVRIGSIGLWTDVTQLKQVVRDLEEAKIEAEAANLAKSTFLANMSHEIRTPMNAIIGMTHLALKSDLNEKQRNYISKASYSAESLLGIINDILDFSKVEAGKLKLEALEFQLRDVIDHSINLLRFKADERAIRLLVNIDDDVPKGLIGDPMRLGQILTNLGTNAVKFSSRGAEVALNVSLVGGNEYDSVLKFSVRDYGIGMSEKQQLNLFQVFTQADNSTTRKYGGTGLGLVISQKIVEAMGGEITVTSQIDVGSTFSFNVPFKKQQRDSRQEMLPDSSGEQEVDEAIAKIRGSIILLVEDNEINQELAREILVMNGITVETAVNGQEALDLLTTQDFDLVLMDCQMPIMDGYEATRQLRKQGKFADMPVLALTANALKEDIKEALNAGMNDHIAKPINPDAMLKTIAKWI